MGYKKKNKEEIRFVIEDYIGPLKSSDSHDWIKAVAKITWFDNPTTVDIRSMNLAQDRVGRGLSLSNEEADRLVNLLVEKDYGDMETLESAIQRRRNLFTVHKPDDVYEEPIIIEARIKDDD